jgi:RNA polymerase III transcription factor (TF)IIIC subunit HTH domain
VPVATELGTSNVADGEALGGEVNEELAYYSRRRLEPNAKLVLSTLSVPTEPHEGILNQLPKLHRDLLERLQQLFEERPIWTRIALANQFEVPRDRQTIIFNKALIPQVCYTIIDGPWKDTLVRYGYDVRLEKEARIYQRISFRVVTKKPEGRQSKKLTRSYGSVAPKRSTAQRSATSGSAYGDPAKADDAEVDQDEGEEEEGAADVDEEDDLLGEEANMSK